MERDLNARLCRVTLERRTRFDIFVGLEDATGHGVDPISAALLAGQSADERLLRLMHRLIRPGQTLLDLGAHIGSFTLAAAKWGGRVIAVEADPRNVELLEASVRRNGFESNVCIVPVAVHDQEGTLEFSFHGPFGHVRSAWTDLPAVAVPARTVDALLEDTGCDRIDLIKMDVEGSELRAVAGMQRLLERDDAPVILYESNCYSLGFYDATPIELRARLRGLGYQYHYRLEAQGLVPIRPRELQPDVLAECVAGKSPLPSLPGFRLLPMPTDRVLASRWQAAWRTALPPIQRALELSLRDADLDDCLLARQA